MGVPFIRYVSLTLLAPPLELLQLMQKVREELRVSTMLYAILYSCDLD